MKAPQGKNLCAILLHNPFRNQPCNRWAVKARSTADYNHMRHALMDAQLCTVQPQQHNTPCDLWQFLTQSSNEARCAANMRNSDYLLLACWTRSHKATAQHPHMKPRGAAQPCNTRSRQPTFKTLESDPVPLAHSPSSTSQTLSTTL